MEKGEHLKRQNRPTMLQLQYLQRLSKVEKKRGAQGSIAEYYSVNRSTVNRYFKSCIERGILTESLEFTLQEKNGNTTENKYIDAKGIKHNEGEVVELTTDDNGEINVVGLDEGTYVLKEVKPAPGYNNSAANGVTFTIRRTLNQTGAEVKPDATSAIVAGQDVVQADSAKAEVGKLSFTIVDQKGSGLPLTGLNGVTFTWIAGGAVLCIGVAHLIRSRKQAEESEQE